MADVYSLDVVQTSRVRLEDGCVMEHLVKGDAQEDNVELEWVETHSSSNMTEQASLQLRCQLLHTHSPSQHQLVHIHNSNPQLANL